MTPPSAFTASERPPDALAEESLTWTVAFQVPPLVRFVIRTWVPRAPGSNVQLPSGPHARVASTYRELS
jgi:hypothetical protein